MLQGITAYNRPEARQAWRGPSLLVLDNQGRASADEPLNGYFFRETRYLSVLRLLVNGEEPVAASAAEVSTNEMEFSSVYPPVETRGGGGSGSGGDDERHGILSRGVDLDLRFLVLASSVRVSLEICNRWNEQVDLELAWALSADYAPLLRTMDGAPEPEHEVVAEPLDDGVLFRYLDPALPFRTAATISGGGSWRYSNGRLSAAVRLARQESRRIVLEVRALDTEDEIGTDGESAREEALREYRDRLPLLSAPGDTPLIVLTRRALVDLGASALLDGPEDEWLTPAAGYPLYPAAFGRDAATTSWQAAGFDRGDLVRHVAVKLARLQGTERDDARDEQPGRIIQQARRDPLSRTAELPFDRYYGDVASPFMYIIALGHAYAWSGDREMIQRHWDPMRRVLDWAREHGDLDGDGYIEYRTRSEHGPKHQAWKDSDNAVVDERGEQIGAPFASCETQGYYLGALQFMAAFALALGERSEALSLWREASQLKERFNRDFWLEDEGYVAFGLDEEKRPVRVLTSNAAQCIPTGIVADEHLPRLVDRIFQPDLFSGWGIRTISTSNPSYNPLSYHLGTVWPVENGSILFGLRRYGFDDRVVQLARAMYDLAMLWPGGRTPECVGGYPRSERGHPGAYPQANSFQSWNQSAFPILLQTLLGAQPVAALHLLSLDPLLPEWLPEVTIRGWRIGEATVSVRFWRDAQGDSDFEVLEKDGELRIMRQAPVGSLSVGLWSRLGTAIRDALPF